jgi:hypothetical protein
MKFNKLEESLKIRDKNSFDAGFTAGIGWACSGDAERILADAPMLLKSLRGWLEFHLGRLEHRQSKHSGSIIGSDGWAGAPIPDWDLKQRIAEITVVLDGIAEAERR